MGFDENGYRLQLVAVALANKFARIAWRLMISGGVYNQPVAAMPT